MLDHETDVERLDSVNDRDLRGREGAGYASFDSITQPDCLLPSQYFGQRAGAPVEGEMRLLVAVLQDAINVYARTVGRKGRRHIEQFAEVSRWFEATNAPGLFAFENVCEILGIRSGQVRHWLKSLRADVLNAQRESAIADNRPRSRRRGWRLNLGRPRGPRAPSLGRRTRSGGRTRRDEQSDTVSHQSNTGPRAQAEEYA